MSAQNDFSPGFDLTSIDPLVGATQAQVQQAIAQVAPLSNIGLFIYSATEPDVANNPRFARYGWWDISDITNPILKRYKIVNGVGSWSAAGVANDAIVPAMLAQFAVSLLEDDNVSPKIALRTDAAANLAKKNFVVRIDPTGTYLEAVSLDTWLQAAGPIGLNRISTDGGADNYILSIIGGILAYRAFDASTVLQVGSVPINTLANSTAYFIVGYGADGKCVATALDPSLYLTASGAAANDVLAFDGTHWVKKTPPLVNITTSADFAFTNANAQLLAATNHNLGKVPSIIKIYYVNKADTGGAGYAVGDLLLSEFTSGYVNATSAVGVVKFNSVWANANQYGISSCAQGAVDRIAIPAKATGAQTSLTLAQFIADWNVRVVLMA